MAYPDTPPSGILAPSTFTRLGPPTGVDPNSQSSLREPLLEVFPARPPTQEGQLEHEQPVNIRAREEVGGTSGQAFMNTYRAIVGTGILALPGAMKACGLGYGIALLLASGLVSLTTMQLLLRCITCLRQRARLGEAYREWEYTDLGRQTLGSAGAGMVLVAAVVCQVGSCVAYLMFIANTVMDISSNQVSTLEVLLSTLPMLVVMSWLSSTKHLAPTSTLGNVAFVVVCGCVFWYGICYSPPRSLDNYKLFDFSGIPVFLGVSIFVMTAHCEVISIEQGLSTRARKSYPTILNITFAVVIFTYLVFGILCYLFFGENTNDIILVNIDSTSPIVIVIKGMMTISLLFQYPVTMFPALSILDEVMGLLPSAEGALLGPGEFPSTTRNFMRSMARYINHTSVVVFTVVLAYVTPDFESATGLIGAFANGVVAYTLPLVFYIQLHKEDMKKETVRLLVAITVAITVVWIACSIGILAKMVV